MASRIAQWRELLADVPQTLSLPTDAIPLSGPSTRGGQVPVRVAADSYRQLQTLAQGAGATPFMALHAALAALLHRLGYGDDVLVGTPSAAWPDPALDRLVGYFANTLVLRADLSGNPTFRELLARCAGSTWPLWTATSCPSECWWSR